MASHSEQLKSVLISTSQHSGIPDASHPHSPPQHPHFPLPSALRVKTAASERVAPLQLDGRSDDRLTSDDNGLVPPLPLQTANNVKDDNNATNRSANDTFPRCDNNNDDNNIFAAAAPPTTGAAPSAPQLLLPLMPAMIGPTEICAAEVWSKDPNFMIYCYKITLCTHRTPHDWRVCPWAHPNERAARRCPRMFVYASVPCANARSGRPCAKGPACEYSHNVTEYWLHPTRFRAEWCSLGQRCNRRLCFFAHSDGELRSTDASVAPTAPPALPAPPPAILQPPHVPQPSYLDLLAHSATSLSVGQLRTRAHPAEQQQQQRQQHQQQLPNQQQQQQASFDAHRLDASASTDDARQHEILRLLMTAVAPPPPVASSTIPQPLGASAADPALMRRHQQQQRQSSVSAVPAFCDLLGAVAPAPPAATRSQLAPALAEPVYAPAVVPPKYVLDASSAELIAAILQSLPTA